MPLVWAGVSVDGLSVNDGAFVASIRGWIVVLRNAERSIHNLFPLLLGEEGVEFVNSLAQSLRPFFCDNLCKS